jgi:hypothetical protein
MQSEHTEAAVARQFTLDLEFAASFVGHAVIIIFIVFGFTRLNSICRWFTLSAPVVRKKKKSNKNKSRY